MNNPDWSVLGTQEQHDKKMKVLLFDLNAAASCELLQADRKHNQQHNSPHEAYAVILEEYLEAKRAMEQIDPFMDTLLTLMMADVNWKFINTAKILKKYALRAAAELVQVAAMCDKTARGFAFDTDSCKIKED